MKTILKILVGVLAMVCIGQDAWAQSAERSVDVGIVGAYSPDYCNSSTDQGSVGITASFRLPLNNRFFILPTLDAQYMHTKSTFLIIGMSPYPDDHPDYVPIHRDPFGHESAGGFSMNLQALVGLKFNSHFAFLTGPTLNCVAINDHYNESAAAMRWAFGLEYRLKKFNFRVEWHQHVTKSDISDYLPNSLSLAVTYTIPL